MGEILANFLSLKAVPFASNLFLAQGFKDSRLSKMLFSARWSESSQSSADSNIVNRAI
jgi:hypothetical protein